MKFAPSRADLQYPEQAVLSIHEVLFDLLINRTRTYIHEYNI